MNEQNHSMADRVEADVQDAVTALIDASTITRVRASMKRENRREFLIQEAEHEAQLLEREGHPDLSGQLRRAAEGLRILQPKVAATGQGDLRT